jgi:hypothetical protein
MQSPEQDIEQPANEETHATGNGIRPADDKTTSILAGFGILLFILLLCTMYTVSSYVPGTGQTAGMQKATASGSESPDGSQSIKAADVTPVITPVIISSTPAITPAVSLSTPAMVPAVPRSYVTLEAVPVPAPPKLQDLTQDMPAPSTQDYFTIYSMNDQEILLTLPYVSFNLLDPPLVIEYDITPYNVTEVKAIDYKIKSTVYHEKLSINRPYEQTWFKVIVRDRETGKVVLENGYGRTYSQDPHGRITLYTSGHYRFEFSGEYARVTLAMKVKKEGNIS